MSLGEAFADLEETLEEAPDVSDADGANRILGALARLDREAREDREVADAVSARAQGWLEGRDAARSDRVAYLEGVLERYHAARRAADPKAKTIELPNGKLKSRASKAAIDYVDEAAAVEYLATAWPTTVTVTTTRKIDRTKAARAFRIVEDADGPGKVVDSITGEIVPGVAVKPAGVTYSRELA